MRHLDNTGPRELAVEVTRGFHRQLATEKFRLCVSQKADLLVEEVVFVTQEHHHGTASTIEKTRRLPQYRRVIAGRRMRHHYQIVVADPEQAPAVMDEVI